MKRTKCTCVAPHQIIDKNEYHKLAKVVLAAGMSLERDSKGVLMLIQASGSACVVPGNLKFEKAEALTPAQLADRAEILGSGLSGLRSGNDTDCSLQAGGEGAVCCGSRSGAG